VARILHSRPHGSTTKPLWRRTYQEKKNEEKESENRQNVDIFFFTLESAGGACM
jgi:hypothetical protein